MKNSIVLFAVFFFMFLGCNRSIKHVDSNLQKESSAIALKAASVAPEKIDSILLGFKFGFSKQEVTNHFIDLLQSKKLQENTKGLGVYLLPIEGQNVECVLDFDYVDDQLYKLVLHYDNSPETQLQIYNLYKKEYNENNGFEIFTEQNYWGEDVHSFIKDNLVIRIYAYWIQYINYPKKK